MIRYRRTTAVLLTVALTLGADALEAEEPAAPKKRALLVGVSTYRKAGLADKPLPYAAPDMERLAKELTAAHWTVTLLTSKGTTNDATRANVSTALDTLLNGVEASDLVLVALSGHGVQFKAQVETDDGEQSLEEAFFCPSDGEPGQASTLLGMTELTRKLGAKGGRNLVLVDACRNDPRRGGKGIDGNSVRQLPGNVAVLLSCAARQQSFETNQMYGPNADKGHGVFFHRVLKGLEGDAGNNKGEVTWARLVEYVQEHVNDDAVKWFPERVQVTGAGEKIVQTPQLAGSLVGRSPVLLKADAATVHRRGVRLLLGGGGIEDRRQALAYFKQAADAGHAPAMHSLAIMLGQGYGVTPINSEEVARLLKRSAESGYAPAKVDLLIDPESGELRANLDPAERKLNLEKALPSLRELAAAGDTNAQVRLSNACGRGLGVAADRAEAVRLIRSAAEQGCADGQTTLGMMLADGQWVRQDAAEAVRWLRKAADQHHAAGQVALGGLLMAGQGVAKDEAAGVRGIRLAADQGSALGQMFLGLLYEYGRGVKKDDEEAVRWYRKSAEQGHPIGQQALGAMYARGTGVTKDETEAIKWLRKSAGQGNGNAKQLLRQLKVEP